MERIDLNGKTILVTGGAGFIGSNLIKRLFKDVTGSTIINIDNLNDYYDVRLKEYRLKELKDKSEKLKVNYHFVKGDIADKALIDGLFEKYHFDVVVNLAAQAGVRYSITNPDAYIQSNMIGFYNILEACTGWIILCRCMRLPRRATSCLPTVIQNCMTFPPRACVSLRSMVLPVVLIWLTLASPISC